MPLVDGPDGPLECLVTGSGDPTTVFAHGFASSIDETRPFGSGVEGRRVFFHFRGHGQSVAPNGPWTYAGLAAELSWVSDLYDARRGLAISLGAGALLRVAAHHPQAYERLVLVLPAAIDQPRCGGLERVHELAQLAAHGRVEAITRLILAEQAGSIRSDRSVLVWARRRAERLCGVGVRGAIRQLPLLSPLDDRSVLAGLECPVLLIGQRGDDAHPVRVVHELAEALPAARVEVFSPGGIRWTHRDALRQLVTDFLNT